jgi:hypothetical protein
LPLCLNLHINWLTLWFSWMVSKHWLTLSSLEYIWFHGQPYFVRLLQQSWLTLKMAFYYNQYPVDTFFSLATKVFGCLHQWTNYFLHCNANMAWIVKGMNAFFFQFCIHFIGKGWWCCNKRRWCLFLGVLLFYVNEFFLN